MAETQRATRDKVEDEASDFLREEFIESFDCKDARGWVEPFLTSDGFEKISEESIHVKTDGRKRCVYASQYNCLKHMEKSLSKSGPPGICLDYDQLLHRSAEISDQLGALPKPLVDKVRANPTKQGRMIKREFKREVQEQKSDQANFVQFYTMVHAKQSKTAERFKRPRTRSQFPKDIKIKPEVMSEAFLNTLDSTNYGGVSRASFNSGIQRLYSSDSSFVSEVLINYLHRLEVYQSLENLSLLIEQLFKGEEFPLEIYLLELIDYHTPIHMELPVLYFVPLKTDKENPSFEQGYRAKISALTWLRYFFDPESRGRQLTATYAYIGHPCVLGRKPVGGLLQHHCPGDILFNENDKAVSINHFMVTFTRVKTEDSSSLKIVPAFTDLGSSNCSYIRVDSDTKIALREGDMFLFGDINLMRVQTIGMVSYETRQKALTDKKSIIELNPCHGTTPYTSSGSGFSQGETEPELKLHALGGQFMKNGLRNVRREDGQEKRQRDITFGRENCSFNLTKDKLVSGVHCQVNWVDNIGFTLRDCDSKNGTWWALSDHQQFYSESLSAPFPIRREKTEVRISKTVLQFTLRVP